MRMTTKLGIYGIAAVVAAFVVIGRVTAAGGVITTAAGGGTGDGGPATSAALSSPWGVAADSGGNLYIADAGNCTIREVRAGVISTIAGDATCGEGDDGAAATRTSLEPWALALDASGTVYVAEFQSCRVRAISGGTIGTIAGTGTCGYTGDGGTAAAAQLNSPLGLAVDAAGHVYIADSLNCRVREVAGGVISTVAGSGTCGFSGDGGAATVAQIGEPTGIAVDAAGNLYIADTDNCRVREVSAGTISTIAGSGSCTDSGDGGAATSAGLTPRAVAMDRAGHVYVADSVSCRIREISGGLISAYAGNGSCAYSGDGAPATSAGLNVMVSIGTAGSSVFVNDASDCRVREISGGTIATIAGTGACGFGGDGGSPTSATLGDATGAAMDVAGHLYIADESACRVREIAGGAIRTIAGNGDCAYSGDGGAATSAGLQNPWSVALAANGDVYIQESDCRIRRVSGGTITTVAGDGDCFGAGGDGRSATSASLGSPRGIAVDGNGDLYIADRGRCAIREVTDGVINTIAGNGRCGDGSGTGPATSVSLAEPLGIAVDAGGSVYFSAGCTVEKVSGGNVSTLAGSGTCGSSGDGGLAVAADLDYPQGIAVDGAGNVYITESASAGASGCRVREVSAGMISTIAGGSACGFAGDGGAATSAELSRPENLAVDASGQLLYVADGARVRSISGGVQISTAAPPSSVGGIAEVPNVAALPARTAGSATPWAMLAAIALGGLLGLSSLGYAWRRRRAG